MKDTYNAYTIILKGVSIDSFYGSNPKLQAYDEDNKFSYSSSLTADQDQGVQRTCQLNSTQDGIVCPITSTAATIN